MLFSPTINVVYQFLSCYLRERFENSIRDWPFAWNGLIHSPDTMMLLNLWMNLIAITSILESKIPTCFFIGDSYDSTLDHRGMRTQNLLDLLRNHLIILFLKNLQKYLPHWGKGNHAKCIATKVVRIWWIPQIILNKIPVPALRRPWLSLALCRRDTHFPCRRSTRRHLIEQAVIPSLSLLGEVRIVPSCFCITHSINNRRQRDVHSESLITVHSPVFLHPPRGSCSGQSR